MGRIGASASCWNPDILNIGSANHAFQWLFWDLWLRWSCWVLLNCTERNSLSWAMKAIASLSTASLIWPWRLVLLFPFSREALSCSRDDYDHAQRLSDWREVRPVLVDGERDPKIHNLFKIAAVESSEICWMNADIFNHIDAGEIPIWSPAFHQKYSGFWPDFYPIFKHETCIVKMLALNPTIPLSNVWRTRKKLLNKSRNQKSKIKCWLHWQSTESTTVALGPLWCVVVDLCPNINYWMFGWSLDCNE